MAEPVQAWTFWHNGPFGTMSSVKFCIADMLLRERKDLAVFEKLQNIEAATLGRFACLIGFDAGS